MTKFKLFALAALALSPALSADARWLTREDIVTNHRNCRIFLKMPAAKQAPIARKLGVTTRRLVNSCLSTTRMGVDKNWALERQWQRAQQGGGGSSRGRGPHESAPNTAGTCYLLSSCTGDSTSASDKRNCPGGWGSFKASSGATGCEAL